MCIIVIKPKGIKLPSKDIFRNCWNKNPHGAGFMFNENGKVIIKKGYMTFNDFYNELVRTDEEFHLKNRGLVIHFRIATSGLIDKGNCHPYPLSDSINDLRDTYIKTEIGVAHNGIISFYNRKDKTLNDTQMFIKNDLFELFSLDKMFYFNPIFQSMIERLINGSRFVFLNGNGDFVKVDNWHSDDGLLFSNMSYFKMTHVSSKYEQIIDIEDDNEFIVNGQNVEEDDFLEMKDYLENIPYGTTIYSSDYLNEYSWRDKNIFIDTIDNSIYYVNHNKISYLGEYKEKKDFV